MIEKIKKYIWRSEGHETLATPNNMKAKFQLIYEDLTLGYLSLEKGKWAFEYSEEFKQQSKIKTLTAFPDGDKKYVSSELWPFFIYRIPGLNQPEVRKVISKNKIDDTNEVDLLKAFGEYTIFNPFRLKIC